MTFRNILLLCALAGIPTVRAESDTSRLDSLQSTVAGIMAKAGIHFGGEFRSQFLLSRIGGEGAAMDRRIDESVEYTSVDFDIQARPNSALRARVMFRMHQDWRNFFSDISNPIFLRWVSIDGLVKNIFGYAAGDFREQYSPLTLYTPQVDLLFEPELFERLREVAMAEEFIGDNDRVLQGVNLNFDAEIYPVFKEFHANIMASRLRLSEGSIKNGSRFANSLEAALMDKYVLGANLDLIVTPGLSLGGSFLPLFDLPSTYSSSSPPRYDTAYANTNADLTFISAGRAGVSSDLFLPSETFTLGFTVEYANSNDRDSAWYHVTYSADSTDSTVNFKTKTASGNALAAKLSSTIALGETGGVKVTAGYMHNDPEFRNCMAQSPSFIGERIMNSENDPVEAFKVQETYYSTFDAMYGSVFKFVPSSNNTNRWHKAPFRKLSYTKSTLTRQELVAFAARNIDTAVQLMLPLGLATPNRRGLRAFGEANLFKRQTLSVKGEYSVLSEIEGVFIDTIVAGDADSGGTATRIDTIGRHMPVTEFSRLGGGFALDFSGLIAALRYPLRVSAGYRQTIADNAGIESLPLTQHKTTVGFLNAGLYWKFWKKAAFLAAYQNIRTDANLTRQAYTFTEIQQHWGVGLEWTVAEGGALIGRIGRILVSYEDDDPATAEESDPSAGNFDQWQTELFLRVAF